MSELLFLEDIDEKIQKKLELKCGIEIHQQLNCGKLFSKAPCKIIPNEELNKQIQRKLRFSLSETGKKDIVAFNEFKLNKKNIYLFNNKVVTLVDLDEEPPSKLNKCAFECAIQISQILGLVFFDNLIFMRKIIVDGSIVSGFQRTAVLGMNGRIKTSFGDIGIEFVNLEEDSARAIKREKDKNIFALDRQGIPLIEITTKPQIKAPKQAFEIAQLLGNILRSFSQTKRGLGTIRQDLNVSINGGARVEIKGVQNLKFIPKIIEIEMKRQAILISIKKEIQLRGIDEKNFTNNKIFDVTYVFENTKSNVVKENLKNLDFGVFAISLFNFKGILGHTLSENFRFATEIKDRNKKAFESVDGLFHYDELPDYGIEVCEINEILKYLNLKENDSFILIIQKKELIIKFLKILFQLLTV